MSDWLEREAERQYHSSAALFPLLEGPEFDELKADIAANGLLEPIWLHPDGSIIDGRNRHRACIETKTRPEFRTWDGQGSLVSFVVSMNLHRRHLTSSQRAAISLDVLPMLEAEAKERQGARTDLTSGKDFPEVEPGRPRDQAADLFQTNSRYVQDAKRLQEQAPDLLNKVRAGEQSIPQAKRELKKRERETERAETAKEIGYEPAIITKAHYREWLPSQSPCDLLLTDPPYMTDVDDVTVFANDWLPMALNKVKPTGRAYICIGAYPDELQAYLGVPTPEHLVRANVLVWTYRNTLGPSPKHDYKNNWQAILYYRGCEAPPLDSPSMIEQFSVQDIAAPDGRHGNRWHTWQKPDELAERLVRHSTEMGAIVLDPFAGTGSFILAASRLGRIGYGCDIAPNMIALAQKRGCHVT